MDDVEDFFWKGCRDLMSTCVLIGDALAMLRTLPPNSVDCCVTSPPYWALRDYGTARWEGGAADCDHAREVSADPKNPRSGAPNGRGPASQRINARACPKGCGATRVDAQIGLEDTPQAWLRAMVDVFAEVRRVLAPHGTCWVNVGDKYMSDGGSGHQGNGNSCRAHRRHTQKNLATSAPGDVGLKPKDLCLLPARLAIALQDDGWYVRQRCIWCLSGGTFVYARTQKGDMPMTVKDMARLKPETVQLWNGQRWTRLLGVSKSSRRGDEIEIVLRSGERISCTPTHRFPTTVGLLDAKNLTVGDTLLSCRLPEPKNPRDCAIDDDAAWFAGLYIAEGARSGEKITLSGHVKEFERWNRVQSIATKFGGSATLTTQGNNQTIRVFGKVLNAVIDELVTGRTAHDKGFSAIVWRYSNRFIAAMVDGYLAGDGHADGNRWRLGFCRNYNLEQGLRTACARLGYTLTLAPAMAAYNGKQVPTFRGELRKTRSGHVNERDRNEIVEIRKARCREVYDLGVSDEPHLFSLASGVLTHNSKPSPMPESTKDRPTTDYEDVLMLTKSEEYYFDSFAVMQPGTGEACGNKTHRGQQAYERGMREHRTKVGLSKIPPTLLRNLRAVWRIASQPFADERCLACGTYYDAREKRHLARTPDWKLVCKCGRSDAWLAHFATFPPALPDLCIRASTSERGNCAWCGKPIERIVERPRVGDWNPDAAGKHKRGAKNTNRFKMSAADEQAKSHRLNVSAAVAREAPGVAHDNPFPAPRHAGWKPCCPLLNADGATRPAVVLDPFGGAFTTALAAERLGRDAIMIELNPEYAAMGEERLRRDRIRLAKWRADLVKRLDLIAADTETQEITA